jgi:predicted choloylglycine hydrolase
MHETTLRGTHAQMGTQDGEIAAKIGMQLPAPEIAMLDLANRCERVAMQHTPELVEEMHAFADAAHIPYDTFKTFVLTVPLQQTAPSCSVFAVMPERSANGKAMVGRNYDFMYDISWEAATTYKTYPSTGHAHIGNCDIWIGREDGMNDAGLFVAMSATFLRGVQPGLPFWFIVRHLLEMCTTVDEALDWISAVPHSQSRNYMLADSTRALVVEGSIEGVRVREPQNGVLVMTNHPLHPDFAARAYAPDDSAMRYNRLCTLPPRGVTWNDMQEALGDRANRVNAHDTYDGQAFGTIWSVIACPANRRFGIAQGTGKEEGTMTYREYSI